MFGSWFSKAFDPVEDVVDLRGKVAIVTGGNRGIGYTTIQYLSRAGAKVYMAARDKTKATEAIQALKQDRTCKGEVLWLKLDLSDPREAKKSAEEFLRIEVRLDILINNAALLPDASFEKTKDGPSMMTNVNYISPYIFTETLLPLMSSIALSDPESDVRIVNVSSNAHKFLPSSPPIKFTDVEDFCPEYTGKLGAALMRYGHSKLIEILWTKHLQHRLDSSTPPVPIIVISIHPGAVDTYSDRYPIARLLKPLLYGADRGSHTSIFAAAGKIVKEKAGVYKGQYLVNNPVGKIVRPTKPADDEQLAEDLYQLTRKFLDGIGL